MLWVLALLAVQDAPVEPAGVCRAGPAEELVGKYYRRGVPTRAKRLSGARLVRVVYPGEVTTMEFREDRVTLRLDYRRRITAVRCG
jgi:hypothetical protein